MPSGTPRPGGPVNVRGSDDSCCGIFFLKNVLNIFNFILLLSGAGILAVGLWTFFDKRWFIGLLDERQDFFNIFVILMYSLIGIGGFIIIFVFSIGCCGSVRKSRGCLMLFSVLLLIVFLLEAGSGVLTFMYEMEVHNQVERYLNGTIGHRYTTNEAAASSVDHMQKYKRCCGVNSHADWLASEWYKSLNNNDTHAVPDSCCKTIVPGCGTRINPNNIYYRGCLTDMREELRIHLNIMSAVGMGLCCLQIFGIIFACCLAKRVQKWNSRNENSFWQQ